MVVGEPTGSKMMRLQKGMLKVRLSCKGVACHSGYPHLGVSAIDPLVEVLHAIKHRAWPSSEELGSTTVNIGLMEGGQAANALAEASEAVAMFRLIGDPEEVLSAVTDIAAEHDCTVEVTRKSHVDPALICLKYTGCHMRGSRRCVLRTTLQRTISGTKSISSCVAVIAIVVFVHTQV